jgi:leader peptidase (prepilin peptidase) / N-methyltransferase
VDPFFVIFAVASGSLGLILGSFINALSFRFNTGRIATLFSTTSTGRSRCMRCGHVLGVLDLLPVFSWIVLRGHCRYCGSRISWQYPLVELTGGVLALGAFLNAQSSIFVFILLLAVFLTMLFIAVYDLRHAIIPWSASLTLMGLVCLYQLLFGSVLFSALDGVILAAPLLLISFVSKERWMGWGDGVLELGLGWLLGLTVGLTALFLAFWAGALVGIVLLWARKGITMKSEVPFAPFLILGALVAFLFHVDIFASLPALL